MLVGGVTVAETAVLMNSTTNQILESPSCG
jgi:hypothetical protein